MFVTYSEPIENVWRSPLSFYLSHYPIRIMNPPIGAITVNGNIYFYWNFSARVKAEVNNVVLLFLGSSIDIHVMQTYSVMVIPWRNNFKRGIKKHFSQIKSARQWISRSRLTILNTKVPLISIIPYILYFNVYITILKISGEIHNSNQIKCHSLHGLFEASFLGVSTPTLFFWNTFHLWIAN